ncbi:hypothetical protein [Aeromonas allosaccharophila]|uniref:hypothetical protein n=1 Tax=Aeromonas allosaccharophila TaxID=656 RepID=UPI0036DEB3B0
MFPIGSASANTDGVAIISSGTGPVTVNKNIHYQTQAVTSLLTPIMVRIIDVYNPSCDVSDLSIGMPGVEEKIKFNAVKAYAYNIIEYCNYMSVIEMVIDNIDSEEPGAKEKFLWTINKKYKDVKRQIIMESGIDPFSDDVKVLINTHADKIISLVSENIMSSATSAMSAPIELIEAAQELIVCYGFINCQILEAPQ